MRKTLVTFALLCSIGAAPGFTGSAAAYESHHHGRSAWSIVRNDPCLYNEYERFAREHQNENKRARFVERLAREGCDREAYARLRHERAVGYHHEYRHYRD
jgi:hypothetical protein